MTRDELDRLRDDLYVLECAVEDVERDLAEASGPDDVADALQWLLTNAKPLQQTWIEPRMDAAG